MKKIIDIKRGLGYITYSNKAGHSAGGEENKMKNAKTKKIKTTNKEQLIIMKEKQLNNLKGRKIVSVGYALNIPDSIEAKNILIYKKEFFSKRTFFRKSIDGRTALSAALKNAEKELNRIFNNSKIEFSENNNGLFGIFENNCVSGYVKIPKNKKNDPVSFVKKTAREILKDFKNRLLFTFAELK